MSFVRPVPWTRQPQGIAGLNLSNPLARRAVVVVMPAHGYAIVNGITRPLFAPTAVTPKPKFGTYWYAGTSSQYANLGLVRNISSTQRFTLFSTWLSDDGQYNGVDVWRYLLSTRTAGNAGWSWGRYAAIAGGASGNLTKQTFALQGVASYDETSWLIESLEETSVASTISATTWTAYRNGVQTHTASIGTMSAGGDLYFGVQGPVAAGTYWLDRAGITVAFDDVLSVGDIKSLHDNPWQLFAPITRRIWVPSAGGATTHTSTGALAALAASIAGTATHKTLHTSTGALASQAAAVAGTATHKTLHASTGALAAQAAAIAGTADHTTPSGATHTATGALAAQAAEIAGTAIHRILHTSTGDLIAQSAAVIAGTAIHYALHTSSGALASQSATIAGSASGPGPDDVSGDTIGALRSISHNTHRRM